MNKNYRKFRKMTRTLFNWLVIIPLTVIAVVLAQLITWMFFVMRLVFNLAIPGVGTMAWAWWLYQCARFGAWVDDGEPDADTRMMILSAEAMLAQARSEFRGR